MKSIFALALIAASGLLAAQPNALAWNRFDQNAGLNTSLHQGLKAEILPNGRIAVAGYYFDNLTGNSAAFVSHYSRSQTLLWNRTVTGPAGSLYNVKGMVVDAQNRVTIMGENGHSTISVTSYDVNGNVLFNLDFDASNGNQVNTPEGIRLGPDGKIYVFGSAVTPGGSKAFVQRITTAGVLDGFAWSDRPGYGTTRVGFGANTVVMSFTSEDLMGGSVMRTEVLNLGNLFNTGGSDYTFGNANGMQGPGLADGTAGNYAVAGHYQTSTGQYADFVRFFRPNPITLNYPSANPSGDFEPLKLVDDPTRNAFTTVSQDISGVTRNLRLRRFNQTGAQAWTSVLNATAGHAFIPTDVTLDRQGEIYVSAIYRRGGHATTDSEFFLGKFSTGGVLRWQYRFRPAAGKHVAAAVALEGGSGDVVGVGEGPTGTSEITRTRVIMLRQAPVALADSYTVPRNTTYTSPRTTTANDRNYVGATNAKVTNPTRGTLTYNANGTFTYRPNANYVGTDSFTYRLSKTGLSSSTATVTFTIR